MPVEKLTYDKSKGLLKVKITFDNIPSWNYKYNEDTTHENNSSLNDPKELTLGMPHEIKKPLHDWVFLLNNTSNFKLEDLEITIKWFQDVDGHEREIHEWKKSDIEIEKGKGEIVEDRIMMDPQ